MQVELIPKPRDKSGGRFCNVDKGAVGPVRLVCEAGMEIRGLHRVCIGMEIVNGPKEGLARQAFKRIDPLRAGCIVRSPPRLRRHAPRPSNLQQP